MGCAAIKSDIARKTGFNSKSFNGDWHYFEECFRSVEKAKILKIPQILFVHN